tara:strand:- start:272 stop:562 length:291 start_codon:yes stop_codon:yes gene_type:complete
MPSKLRKKIKRKRKAGKIRIGRKAKNALIGIGSVMGAMGTAVAGIKAYGRYHQSQAPQPAPHPIMHETSHVPQHYNDSNPFPHNAPVVEYDLYGDL